MLMQPHQVPVQAQTDGSAAACQIVLAARVTGAVVCFQMLNPLETFAYIVLTLQFWLCFFLFLFSQISNSSGSWTSTWLLLKNMTAQIDGSTLRTLCMQHGPLQHFHLYLNHGIALCKYSSREEANKAQMALNNCVLGNTTICAESPCESEVQNILQHLGVPNQQQPPQSQNQQVTEIDRTKLFDSDKSMLM